MNIFLHELRTYRKTTMIWTLALIGIAAMYILIYPAFTKDLKGLQSMLDAYPEYAKKALGFSINTFSSLTGFYSLVITFITLCGAIQAMNIGLSVLSKEIADKTADFLLTKPVSRIKIVTSKLLAALTLLLATNVIYLVAVAVLSAVVSKQDINMKHFLMISLIVLLVQLMFMTLGVLVSVITKRIRSVIAISLSTAFAFFIINMFGSVIGEEAVRYITPFKYYDPGYIIAHSAFELKFLIIEAVFITVAISASYYIYSKKDIHAV